MSFQSTLLTHAMTHDFQGTPAPLARQIAFVTEKFTVDNCLLDVSRVESVVRMLYVVNKIFKMIYPVKPDNKHIVNISVISKKSVWTARQKVLFQFSHEDIGVARRHSGVHGCAAYLQKVLTIKSKYIVFQYKLIKLTNIFVDGG